MFPLRSFEVGGCDLQTVSYTNTSQSACRQGLKKAAKAAKRRKERTSRYRPGSWFYLGMQSQITSFPPRRMMVQSFYRRKNACLAKSDNRNEGKPISANQNSNAPSMVEACWPKQRGSFPGVLGLLEDVSLAKTYLKNEHFQRLIDLFVLWIGQDFLLSSFS